MDNEETVARLLEEYRRRAAAGERPRPEDFRDEAGAYYAEFERLVAGAAASTRGPGHGAEEFPRDFGEYRLTGILGRGGIGVVYRGVQRCLARPVALKILQVEWGTDQALFDRFRRGAQAAAQVEHDHTVRIHDYGVVDGRPFLAMNCLSGPTLAEVYQRLRGVAGPSFGREHHAVLSAAGIAGSGEDTATYVQRLAALLAGPAQALDAYHRRGIVHRDVKPGNLILEGGKLVLTDFDLVKRDDTKFHTTPGAILGTPMYMSPEQWSVDAAALDGRSDVYALGAVLYEGLALRLPFEDADPIRLMSSVIHDRAVDPRRHKPDVPAPAARVVLKCLEKRPGDRYDSADALARDLRALAWNESVAARPVPAARRAGRWIWRRKVPAAAAILVAVLAAAWFAWRPALLDGTTDPVAAEVSVDGRTVGRSPIEGISLSPGSHVVSLRAPGFAAVEERLTCRRGVRYILSGRALKAIDPGSDEVVDAVAASLGVQVPPAEIPVRVQGAGPPRGGAAGEGAATPLLPRGAVLSEDLGRFLVSVRRPASGRLVVTRAGKDVADVPFSFDGRHPIEEVRLAGVTWQEGDDYEWHLEFGGGGLSFPASLRVVREGPALSALRKHFHREDAELAALIEAAALHDAGLHAAAYRRAMELAGTWPRRRVFALAQSALGAMGLSESALGASVMRAYWSAND